MSRAQDDADLRFDEMIVLTEKLTKIVLAEIAILKSSRPKDIEGYGEEKAAYSANYARLSNAMKRDREALKAVSPERRAKLKAVTKTFRDALSDLEARLARARHLSEGLIRAIAEDLSASQTKPVGYGVKAAPTTCGPTRPQAIALNRVV